MIETRRLKNIVIFFQTILSSVLSRKITNIFDIITSISGFLVIAVTINALISSQKVPSYIFDHYS